MEDLFQVPATIQKVETIEDMCIRLKIDTIKELNAEETAKIFKLKKKNGWLVFKSTDIIPSDVPDLPVSESSNKTPSQRLRGVLFVYWETKTNKQELFDTFYNRVYEEIIKKYKEKLD